MEYELLQTILKAFENCHFNCLSTYLPLLPYSCFLYLMVQTIVWLNAYKCLLPFFKVINCSPFLKQPPYHLGQRVLTAQCDQTLPDVAKLNNHDYKQRPDHYTYQVSVYLPSISILIIILSILIFKYWYWYFLFQKRTEILILQYCFSHQYQYFSIYF